MHDHKVSRLLVKDAQGKITGILSFGGILRKEEQAEKIIEVVEEVFKQ